MSTHKPAPNPIRPSQLVNPAPAQATLAATAIEWIANALRLELPDGTADPDIAEQAEVLHAIACNWDVPVETLIAWIHAPIEGKEYTGGEFRRWAQQWRAERREYEWRQAVGDTEHSNE